MFKIFKKIQKKDPIRVELLKGINKDENQIELIDQIRKGHITFTRKDRFRVNLSTQWDEEKWTSDCGNIVFWHEKPGFGSYSYLKVNGEEMIDKIKYGSEIGLTIQNPKKNWVVKRQRIGRSRNYSIKSFDKFVGNA